ncbi:TetR/AcrR family transcriptional regulator C-terminal domain-containing protein [soil metagenome]
MRRIGGSLGVEAISLYNYNSSKDDLLNGTVDLVFGEIEAPSLDREWRTAMTQRARSARDALMRHQWATGLTVSRRSPGPCTLRHHNAVVGCLRSAGFSIEMTAHAYSVIDSYLYGFVIQQMSVPFYTPNQAATVATEILEQLPAAEYPHLDELATEHVLQHGYDFSKKFAYGLDLILPALSHARDEDRAPCSPG